MPPTHWVDEGPVIKLGDIIGRGGIAKVYRGQDLVTGKLLAVKKSRVSLTVRRTAFQHEARMLSVLRSHPAVPQIYAIGRFEHFEYLCLELLGPPLRAMANLPKTIRTSLVPQVAIQMLSALKFIHGLNIAHRDIKPDNILVCSTDQRKIRLIDFSLAYTFPSEPVVKSPNLNPDFVMGTLAFASLNAHQGLTLTRRDDLESLGYTLFWLLRGNLPWSLPHLQSGTPRGRRRQVFAKKQAWPGSRLARDSNVTYGNFLEVARSLKFSETINYDIWCECFWNLTGSHTLSFSILTETGSRCNEASVPRLLSKHAAPFIVASGQLVHIQILAQPTIENFTVPHIDSSYWFDPSLSKENWRTIPRPAIVLKSWRNQDGRVNIKVALLTTRIKDSSSFKILLQPEGKLHRTADLCVAVSGMLWPKLDVWCCAYLGTYTFTCLPTQTKIIPLLWKIAESSLGALVLQLENHQTSFKDNPKLPDTIPRFVTNAHISRILPNAYIQIHSLSPRTFWKTSDNQVVDWDSERGWFDELIPLCRRRIFDEQRNEFSSGEEMRANDGVHDSYFDEDRSVEWSHIQRERAESLTLGWSNYELIDLQIPVIREIE